MRLPLLLCLAICDITSVSAEFRQFNAFRRFANRHSSSLARDLRVAFNGMLGGQTSGQDSSSLGKRSVYCTPVNGVQQQPYSSPNNVSATNSASRRSTSTRSASTQRTTSTTAPAVQPTSSSTSLWKLHKQHSGNTFFNDWNFWETADPTHGTVDYLSSADAWSNNLLEYTSQGTVIMRVETTPQVSGYRKSVRIETQETYDGTLVILDALHMPTGCATWPAFWSNGPNWPYNGEIDIVEGVNTGTNNQATIHTGPGCTLPEGSTARSLGITGTNPSQLNCDSFATANQGCGINSNDDKSFGQGFNQNRGGVFSMQWDDDGIRVFFFRRDAIPADISSGSPNPTGWGQPMAFWPASSCNPFQAFKQHVFIFDTTLCGDWAGNLWQSGGCAASTGVSSCAAFVQSNGAAFQEAYWEVNSVKFYKK